MTSINFNHRRIPSNRGPLKAVYHQQGSVPLSTVIQKHENAYRNGAPSYNTEACPSSLTSSLGYASLPQQIPLARFSGSNLKRKFSALSKDASHQNSDPRVASEDPEDSCEISCACCTPPTDRPPKRPLVAMGAGGLRALRGLPTPYHPVVETPPRPVAPQFGPVCSVPLPPRYSNRSSLQESMVATPRRSIETQTSPPSSTSTGNVRVRRSSGALLVHSIKKKFEHLRRSVSTERFSCALLNDSMLKTPTRRTSETDSTWTLLRRMADGSRLIQMRRPDTLVQFGIYIRRDERGLFVSRLSGEAPTEKGRKILRVGDRVLEVQKVIAKSLDTDTVRGLLQGCHVATIRVKSGKSRL